jgi:hypothetical protein
VPVHQTKSKGKVIKMKVRKKNALRSSAVIRMALAIALVCGVPASFVAQELVKGTFTLSEPVLLWIDGASCGTAYDVG